MTTDDLRMVAPPADPLTNARLFVKDFYDHPDRPRLLSCVGELFGWQGTHWQVLEPLGLRSQLWLWFDKAVFGGKSGPEPFQPNMAKVSNLVDALHAISYLPGEVAAPAWLTDQPAKIPASEVVSCANGILHVPTRAIYSHTPRLFVQHSVPFAFDPDAAEPKQWLEFLDQVWPDDPDSIRALRQIFGYVLSGDRALQKMFLIIGPKRSGKGTVARVLTALMGGPALVAGPTLSSLSTNFGLQPLLGKTLAIISDARISSGQSVITERLLSISGEDMLTVDRKNRDAWTGTLPTRIVMLTNELPRLNDSSGALASRFVPLETTVSFFGREDPHLTDKLLGELPGILNWALAGLDDLREVGRILTPESGQDIAQAMEDLASPVAAFVRECCTVAPGQQSLKDDVFTAWQIWCARQGRTHPGTLATFGVQLKAAVPGLRTRKVTGDAGTRHATWDGISSTVPDLFRPSG
jgi:putative DNA primase/helicase